MSKWSANGSTLTHGHTHTPNLIIIKIIIMKIAPKTTTIIIMKSNESKSNNNNNRSNDSPHAVFNHINQIIQLMNYV